MAPADGRVGLGHRDLAIINPDPRAGQPMVSQCGRFWIVYDGEIYNYRALGGELARRGVRLRTSSDTELLLELFARDGIAALPKLRGMYAFAIWDDHTRTLWLARDPFGIKPLYYSDDGWSVRATWAVGVSAPGVGSLSSETAHFA